MVLTLFIQVVENNIPATAENERRKPGCLINAGEKDKISNAEAEKTLNECFRYLMIEAITSIESITAALTTEGDSPVIKA
jgi:hypothetical protein